MSSEYDESLLLFKNVFKWYDLFRNGCTSLVHICWPGRTVEAATPNTVQQADKLIQEY
jgi:hypothetical protein